MKKLTIRNLANCPDDLRFTSIEFEGDRAKTSISKVNSNAKSPASYPLFFSPIYKQALWGGGMQNIRKQTPITTEPISESWEVSDRPDSQSIISNGPLMGKTLREVIKLYPQDLVGRGHKANQPFPLLIKIIDAAKDLSLQVHPSEEVCRKIPGSESKTECWYVLDCEENAKIMSSAKESAKTEDFKKNARSKKIGDLMNTYDARKNDFYFIPANTMHAIGAGNLIFEIQQNSNTTFRVSDWGRVDQNGKPRELHVAQALKCLEHKREHGVDNKIARKLSPVVVPRNIYSFSKLTNLVKCDFFNVNKLHMCGEVSCLSSFRSCMCLFALDDGIKIEHKGKFYDLQKYRTCLIPACASQIKLHTSKHSNLIIASL